MPAYFALGFSVEGRTTRRRQLIIIKEIRVGGGRKRGRERLVRCRVRDIAVTLHLGRLICARLCASYD